MCTLFGGDCSSLICKSKIYIHFVNVGRYYFSFRLPVSASLLKLYNSKFSELTKSRGGDFEGLIIVSQFYNFWILSLCLTIWNYIFYRLRHPTLYNTILNKVRAKLVISSKIKNPTHTLSLYNSFPNGKNLLFLSLVPPFPLKIRKKKD